MERNSHNTRTDGTADFYGTFLETLQIEDHNEVMLNSPEPIERLSAFIELRRLAVHGISHPVRQRAQEKIDDLIARASNT